MAQAKANNQNTTSEEEYSVKEMLIDGTKLLTDAVVGAVAGDLLTKEIIKRIPVDPRFKMGVQVVCSIYGAFATHALQDSVVKGSDKVKESKLFSRFSK